MPVDNTGAQQRLSFKSIARSQQTRTAGTCQCAYIHMYVDIHAERYTYLVRSRSTRPMDMVNNSCNCVQITELASVHLNAFPRDVFLSIKSSQMDQRGQFRRWNGVECPIKAPNDNNVL